ncbi:SDR family NAD(P)-dependent oxidoreductase [Actinacidiphila sp. ITFR-21]|uniref:SDR family NAD(P)-dependent oxidoreductase n=1 Tax=Actinacidiphila sp. ITFR-21 TaxID=3075199 RepID=UPI00288BEE2C|nr:SDR family NAD(P)-dependent oxidoreductase [Streptomyces sp. ITFR-21]WNI18469.1 SDR family NAD(P)-dependent oxidoreductase [Streptomyces sp. ITFR-21]
MSNKIALVTGGNRGIGRATAIELRRRGYDVVITSRSADAAAAAFADTAPVLRPVHAIEADITNETGRLAIADHLASAHGVLDLLINNAGTWLESENSSDASPNRTSELELSVLRATFETNFFAPVRLTQLLLPLIRKSEAGRILNIASMHASLTLHSSPGSPVFDRKVFGYAASKTALNAFTVPLAHEVAGSGVTVNSLDPGWVRTQMGGPTATLSPQECGTAIADIATHLAPDVNGRFLTLQPGTENPW